MAIAPGEFLKNHHPKDLRRAVEDAVMIRIPLET